MLDFAQFLSIAQQFRNPLIADELSRIQGIVPPRERVNYYGSKWGFAFFSRAGRFLGVPDQPAIESVRACKDLDGPDRLWKKLAGL